MKKLLLFMLLLPLMAPAQKLPTSPGDELIKAKNHFYFGMTATCIGTLTTLMPTIAGDSLGDNKPLIITGGIITLVGFIVTLESFSHIGKAGRKMNECRVGVIMRGNEIGIKIGLNKKITNRRT